MNEWQAQDNSKLVNEKHWPLIYKMNWCEIV